MSGSWHDRGVEDITVSDHDEETHPAWGVAGFNRAVGGSKRLFDSSIRHHQVVTLTISTAHLKRDLHRDWIRPNQQIIEVEMSEAQFGALVSSFGQGSGVPVTIKWTNDDGYVPDWPEAETRLEVSAQEVKRSANEALAVLSEARAELEEALAQKPPKIGEVRKAVGKLLNRMDNLPSNMAFAATSLTEHAENVTSKAKADIEAMVDARARQWGLDATAIQAPDRPIELDHYEPDQLVPVEFEGDDEDEYG